MKRARENENILISVVSWMIENFRHSAGSLPFDIRDSCDF